MTTRLSADDASRLLPAWLRDGLGASLAGEIRLPVLPDTACRVLARCRDEHCDLRELAELVTHDQALAAHVLRVANSVAYAPKTPIQSLQRAIGRLGLSTVCDIAIAVAIKQRVFAVQGHEPRIRELWQHSAATACYAQDVAQLLGRDREGAFLCGLLHDVGMPIVLQAACDVAPPPHEAPLALGALEAAMAAFHAEFGVLLAQRWRLGGRVESAIQHHHDPVAAKPGREDVLVVTLADELAYWATDETRGEEDFAPAGALPAPGVPDTDLAALLGSRARILELSRSFL
jgi:putative nucleotidyltransferase with HDIG domain